MPFLCVCVPFEKFLKLFQQNCIIRVRKPGLSHTEHTNRETPFAFPSNAKEIADPQPQQCYPTVYDSLLFFRTSHYILLRTTENQQGIQSCRPYPKQRPRLPLGLIVTFV